MLFINVLKSQTQEKVEQTPYVNPKDSTLYWNQNSKIYWWVSTSPTDNSQDVLLKSETMPQYSNPMYLDVEGFNTLRTESAAHPKTKYLLNKQIMFEVYADGLPPTSKSELVEAPKHNANSHDYYGKGLELKLSATDQTAGVKNILYSINGASYQKYTAPVDIDKEGEVNLKYYAVDNCGNVEKVIEKKFILDLTAPVTTKEVVGNKIGDVLSQDAKIELKSVDNLAGVKNTFYIIDDGKPQVYTAPIPAVTFFGGKHKINFYAIDNVNNNNISNFKDGAMSQFSYEFILDKTGPTAKMTIVGDKYVKDKTYVSARTKFEIEADDDFSEISSVKYKLNSGAEQIYSTPMNFAASTGFVILDYKSEDKLSNVGKLYSTTVFVDATPPISFIDFSEPQFFDRDTLFISKKTTIKLSSKDAESGVTKIDYISDGGAKTTYSSPFKIESSGYKKITFSATDNVNNIEIEKTSYVMIDNEAPEIYIRFSIEPVREDDKNGKKYPVYPQYTKLYLSATDKSTGTQDILYSINNSLLTKYESTKKINESGALTNEQFYTLKVVAVDKLGNKNEKEVSFFISNK